MAANQLDVQQDQNVLTLRRVFNAPRELVFKAYTTPEHLMHWWGPSEWPLAECTVDLRPGGKWHYCMKEKQGDGESWGVAIYEEIAPPERLAYIDAFSDADGNINESLPTSHTMVTFSDVGGKTLLTSVTTYDNEEALQTVLRMGMIEGITETLGQLEAYLAAGNV